MLATLPCRIPKDALFLTAFAQGCCQSISVMAQDMVHKYSSDFPAFKVAGHPFRTLQLDLGAQRCSRCRQLKE